MKNLLSIIAITFLIVACSETPQPQDEIKKKIAAQEERVNELSKDVKNAAETDSAKVELIQVLLDYYHEFPKDDYSANCLSKVHMIYSSQDNVEMAVAYADTLINNYPNFVDRSQMIESQIILYESDIKPRNVEAIKKYLKLWLKENKDADKEKISDTEYHLKHVDIPLEERIGMEMHELN